MAFARLFDNPNVSQEQYDAVREKTGASSGNIPEGAILHVAGPSPKGGWRVIEVWESEDAAKAWDERLVPMLEQHGIQRPAPETWEPHVVMTR
jgi:hypothetical protein